MRTPILTLIAATGICLALAAPLSAAQPSADDIARAMPEATYQTKPGAPIPLEGGGSLPGVPAFAKTPGAPPPFAVPTGGKATSAPEPARPEASRVNLYRPDGTLYATATLTQGRYDQMAFMDAEGQPVLTTAAEAAARPRAPYRFKPRQRETRGVKRSQAYCGPNYHADAGTVLYGGYMPFYVNQNLWPASVTQGNSNLALLYAADNWNSMSNWCGIADQSSLQFTHAGYTNAAPGAVDGVNTVGFVTTVPAVGACAQAGTTACTLSWGSPNPFEVDIVLARNVNWVATNVAPQNVAPNQLDIESMATHEFGHAAGLAHVSSQGEVMYGIQGYGDASDRKLGRGDTEYTNQKY